ncbi:hypothetical protein JCM9534A_63690 [Catenuloplanes indicus JCM 9534]|uniref:Transposase n=1 Tax=Catenuloplanes indicus TaxID=137267 RepID=A0AAE3W8C9_9ACTN|nr:transposase [Catenuloplanes indicus]
MLYLLYTGTGWEDLPQELGSGMTCWRRLRRWTDAGVFGQLHRIPFAKPNAAGRIDQSRPVMDGGHVDAKRGTRHKVGRRSAAASILITDGEGTPLKVLTTGANVPDISMAVALLDSVPPIAGPSGPATVSILGPARRQRL